MTARHELWAQITQLNKLISQHSTNKKIQQHKTKTVTKAQFFLVADNKEKLRSKQT